MKTKLWPVIHFKNWDLAVENVGICCKCGVENVMLIDHLVEQPWPKHCSMTGVVTRLMDMFVGVKFGLNNLHLSPLQSLAVNIRAGVRVTWADQPIAYSDPERKAEPGVEDLDWILPANNHTLFAGVAFKHQERDPDPGEQAFQTAQRGAIPCTSGPATGQPADPDAVRAMRTHIRRRMAAESQEFPGTPEPWSTPLAIASGIDAGNVLEFAPYLSDILIATGISKDFHRLDEAKLLAVVTALEQFEGLRPYLSDV